MEKCKNNICIYFFYKLYVTKKRTYVNKLKFPIFWQFCCQYSLINYLNSDQSLDKYNESDAATNFTPRSRMSQIWRSIQNLLISIHYFLTFILDRILKFFCCHSELDIEDILLRYIYYIMLTYGLRTPQGRRKVWKSECASTTGPVVIRWA